MDTATTHPRLFFLRSLALVLVAVFMPLWPDLMPVLFVALLLILLPWGSPLRVWRHVRIPWSAPLRWMAIWYGWHLLGMLWTSNTVFGRFDLEVKLLVFLLPLVFMWTPRPWLLHRDSTLRAFMWSTTLMMAFLIARATVLFILELRLRATGLAPDGLPYTNIFFSSYFAPYLHPSYLAMYGVFALAILAWLPDRTEIPAWNAWCERWAIPAVLIIGVILCASKMGWLALIFLLVQVLVVRWKDPGVRRKLMLGATFATVLLLVLVASFATVRVRVTETWDAVWAPATTADNSSTARRMVWDAALVLIKEKPLMGTGTGDVKDELLRTYKDLGFEFPLERRLNAHSQFLQTGVALGILAMLLLLTALLVPLVNAFRDRRQLMIALLILTLINWSVESMMEVQAGVIFFIFFATLLTDVVLERKPA